MHREGAHGPQVNGASRTGILPRRESDIKLFSSREAALLLGARGPGKGRGHYLYPCHISGGAGVRCSIPTDQ